MSTTEEAEQKHWLTDEQILAELDEIGTAVFALENEMADHAVTQEGVGKLVAAGKLMYARGVRHTLREIWHATDNVEETKERILALVLEGGAD